MQRGERVRREGKGVVANEIIPGSDRAVMDRSLKGLRGGGEDSKGTGGFEACCMVMRWGSERLEVGGILRIGFGSRDM